jgi:DNA-binding NtrC family response regulator
MKYRVLIADDDIAVREALKTVLEGTGYEVLTAADGAEAESKINAEPIHLLLLDLGLPRQNGWNVLGLVTAQNPLLPVIIITGLKNDFDARLAPGVTAFFQKPLEVETLLLAMQESLAEPEEVRLRRITAHLRCEEPLQPLRAALENVLTPH